MLLPPTVYGKIRDIKFNRKGGYGFLIFEEHGAAVDAICGSRGGTLKDRVSAPCQPAAQKWISDTDVSWHCLKSGFQIQISHGISKI